MIRNRTFLESVDDTYNIKKTSKLHIQLKVSPLKFVKSTERNLTKFNQKFCSTNYSCDFKRVKKKKDQKSLKMQFAWGRRTLTLLKKGKMKVSS